MKILLMKDNEVVNAENQNQFLFDMCARYFTIPFPPSLPETFDFKASYTIRFDVLQKDLVGIPKKILDYYFDSFSTNNSRYFFSCLWRYWEAAYAQNLIFTLHRWAFQAQSELEKMKDPNATNKIYWPPQGLIDYHFSNFIIRIFSSLDHLACWLNAVYNLGLKHVVSVFIKKN